MNIIQAFVNNISVPKSIEELKYFIIEHGCFNVEEILYDSEVEWTAPSWAKIGDIVFFMHTKTARSYLTALRTELKLNKILYSIEDYEKMLEWIERGLYLHSRYGGKIFAIGRVSGIPKYYDDFNSSIYHWSSRIYAQINEIYVLSKPIDISEFNDKILISRQSAITPVLGDDFNYLKMLITNRNNVPNYFYESVATPLPLSKINRENWMRISNEYRRSFSLEIQYRTYYVNYLLEEISDIKTIYRECRCKNSEIADSFVDNVILFNGKYLPVEVKLSINCEKNIYKQIKKYCNTNYIIIDNKTNRKISREQIIQNRVFVIDTEYAYLYDADSNVLNEIFELDLLKTKTDINRLITILKDKV